MKSAPQSHREGVQTVQIGDEFAGQRIDNFLISRLKGAPRSLVYRILRRGEVRVNGGRVKPDYRLRANDQVRIPPLRLAPERAPGRPGQRVLETLRERVIYEDGTLLVLNKPSGLAVHGGSGLSFGAIEALRALRPDARYLELVHRLDRDTSGCLMVAKKRSMLRVLHELLRTGAVEKHYLALVRGTWGSERKRVTVPLRKNVLRSGERVVDAAEDGKAALSLFEPHTIYGEVATLVDVGLVTGRTHQIRVHAAHIGHPVAGDEKYGDETFNREMRRFGLRRLFLHAHRLDLELPGSGKLSLTAPLDDDLRAVLAALEKR